MLRIWELNTDADRYLCIQPGDLRYFHDRFCGQPMSEGWATPAYGILNRSKKVADFTSWQIGSQAFLVSERARDMIKGLDAKAVEFLPFDSIKGRDLFAANVLRTEDYLDTRRTEYMPGTTLPLRVVWREHLPADLPPIFKIKGDGNTYASAVLGRKAVELGLTGLQLADPGKIRIQQIVRGEQINDFGGL